MRYKKCEICGKRSPQNETVSVDDVLHCNDCFEHVYEEKELLNDKKVIRDQDPTVCSNCNHDYGSEELSKLSVYPVCPVCKKAIDQRVFPNWVKAFIAGTVLVIAIGFVWNLRFFRAYSDIREANANYAIADYTNAHKMMFRAVNEVPELEDIKVMAFYFRGLDLLVKDSCTAALSIFEKYQHQIPADVNMKSLIVQARIGSCYEKKDYQGFLNASLENLAQDSTLAMSWAGVASAYSCLYVNTNNEDYKTKTNSYLHKAQSLDTANVALKDYVNMIEYRIYSKRVVSREEFQKQFPKGWSKI